MHNNPNMRNKQMEINACKILSFCKIPPLRFISHLQLKNTKYPRFFRENGYEYGIRFRREGGVGVGVCV